MTSTIQARLPALLILICLLAWPAPAYAGEQARPGRHAATRTLTTEQRLNLYSPRVRRTTLMYLHLRLLELREEGLDRAAAVIERRLSIDDLLGPRAPAKGPRTPSN